MRLTLLIPVLTSALCLGCSTSRHSAIQDELTTNVVDSVVITEIVHIDTLRIPAEETTLRVKLSELIDHDTVLTARGNWSHARVESTGGTLQVTATCDSLQHLIRRLEREVRTAVYKTERSSTTTEETIRAGVPWYYKAALLMVILYGIYMVFRLLVKIN